MVGALPAVRLTSFAPWCGLDAGVARCLPRDVASGNDFLDGRRIQCSRRLGDAALTHHTLAITKRCVRVTEKMGLLRLAALRIDLAGLLCRDLGDPPFFREGL
jgi:hypothetical protein